MLSRFDLWVDWRVDRELNMATEKIMLLLEGDKSIIEIAHEVKLPISTITHYLDKFFDSGLIEKKYTPWEK